MNVSQIDTSIQLTKLITILFLINISSNSCQDIVVQNVYNFVDKQNYEIDLNYNQLLGVNMYFYSDDNLSLFLVTVYPDTTLSISMKLYTSDPLLIRVIDANSSIFMGCDLNITNLDIYYENFQSDIFVCSFGRNISSCSDYAINIGEGKYINNQNGKVIKNNLIPLGFNSTQAILLEENVISYLAFYEISFQKNYPVNFDRMTMLKWMEFTAVNLKLNVTVFYGMKDPTFDQQFSLQDCYYSQSAIFKDGIGINNNSYAVSLSYLVIFFYLTIVFI